MGRNGFLLAGVCLALAAGMARAEQPCSLSGFAGAEAGRSAVRDAALNPEGDFTRAMSSAAAYGELNGDCAGDVAKLHFNLFGERIETFGDSGSAQENDGYDNHGFVREAYISLTPHESLFIDIGKKDIRNGQFFFVSPLDFLQAPSNYSTRGAVNALGVSWRDTYREGAIVAQLSWFSQAGTLEFAVLPQLANPSHKQRVAEWTTLQRTNSAERYYLSYTTAMFEDFNPRAVLIGGESYAFGIGTSGFINDDWILNVEVSVNEDSQVRKFDRAALDKLQSFQLPTAEDFFAEQSRGHFYQFGAGLRYTTDNNTAISLDYLYQDQGWHQRDWDNYFDTLDLLEGAYQATAADLFRDYQLLFVQEADNMARRDLLPGRNYLMMHLDKNEAELRRLSWESSTIYNLEDRSLALNLHFSSQLTRHFELYLGGGYLGGPDNSEFGRLGSSGVGYAGVRAIW
jgi:hypothetical protein